MGTSITDSYVDADCFNEKVHKKNQAYFTTCNPVYLFTNDNVKALLENMNFNGKLLSVTASFDHQLNAILLGAKDVTSFDINDIAKYFAELKLQAVKYLSYEEFMDFYKLHKRPGKKIKCDATYKNLNKNTVYKLCEDMNYTLSFFFDRLISLGFFDRTDSTGYYAYITKPGMNMYLNKSKYYELQEKISDVAFHDYIDCDVLTLKKYIGNDLYSAMIFSNISSYFKGYSLELFSKLLKELECNLEDDGSIQMGEGFINNTFNVIGGDPIDRDFILKYNDNIDEIKTKKEIITYYHK